jgi:hypothetical protein
MPAWFSRLFVRRFIRADRASIRQVGNVQKEQTYYYYFS